MSADPLLDRLARALAGRYTVARELGRGGMATVFFESGTATGGSAITGTGITVGTAEYMSPEQASGEKRIDARSDVYALAAVLYEMLAGEPPFTGPSAQAIVARVLADSPRPI